MTDETENKPQIEQEVKEEPADVLKDVKEEEKDFVPQLYSQHGGDPRQLDLTYCVLLSGIPTDLLTDPFDQFSGTLKTMLKVGHNIKEEAIKQIVRVPVLDEKALNPNNALRAIIWFSDKMQQCRCLAREKNFLGENQKVELIERLRDDFLQLNDEDRAILENGVVEKIEEEEHEDEHEDEVGDEVDEDVGDEIEEIMEEEEEGHDEHDEDDQEQEEDEENDESKKEEDDEEHMEEEEGDNNEEKKEKKDDGKKVEKKPEEPKKKVYEDEDEKAPFEMEWEGAPEFQWRLCEGNRDEKKLIIDNLLWADLTNVFIYRTIQKATTCEINFPTRFAGEGGRANYGKMTLYFPAFVAIMDEALKHLIYFRSGDNRRIKVFLPQTVVSLKRKEEFEGKLGRLIKPTQRMMELVIKILPEDYTPTLDDACSWFPDQSVIGCDLINDEMGKPCAVVKFETAQEAVTAHASKSFIAIHRNAKKDEAAAAVKTEKSENEDVEEQGEITQCNVFMRGVEAHFGSLLTFYDQRKKAQEQSRLARANKRGPPTTPQKRPAGSTIRGPAQKKRAPSPRSRGGPPPKDSTPRGGQRGGTPRNAGRGGGASGGGGPRRSSPPRSHPRSGGGGPRGPPARGGGGGPRGGSGGGPRGGDRGGSRGGSGGSRGGRSGGGDRVISRAPARSNNYRNDFSSSSSSRGPARADAFSGYGYASFENRYGGSGGGNDRPSVDPFGRPMFNTLAFSSSHSSSSSSNFHRDDSSHRSGGGGNSGYSSFQDNRRRY